MVDLVTSPWRYETGNELVDTPYLLTINNPITSWSYIETRHPLSGLYPSDTEVSLMTLV